MRVLFLRKAGALPAEPTEALPGSEQKIQIMMERAQRREQLFHPNDGPLCGHSCPTVPLESNDCCSNAGAHFTDESVPQETAVRTFAMEITQIS
jgi:hypothetical protein